MKTPRSLFVLALAIAAACTAEAKNGGAAAASAEVLARLEKADAADGKTDKVVEKCAGCSLHMAGKPQFAVKLQDYTLHLCSEDCFAEAKADPAKVVMAMEMK